MKRTPRSNGRIIAIDPSMHSLGLAICDLHGRITNTYHIGAVAAPAPALANCDWRANAFGMAETVVNLLTSILVPTRKPAENHVVIETPIVFQVERGQSSMQAGDIQKLYFTCGLIIRALSEIPCIMSIHGVTPNDWKGQTPKNIVKRRCESTMISQGYLPNVPNISLDTIEAVMIGQFASANLVHVDNSYAFNLPVTPVYRIAHYYSQRYSVTDYG